MVASAALGAALRLILDFEHGDHGLMRFALFGRELLDLLNHVRKGTGEVVTEAGISGVAIDLGGDMNIVLDRCSERVSPLTFPRMSVAILRSATIEH